MLDAADIHRLIDQPDADHTLSIYLMVDAARLDNHAATPGWRIWLKNALRELHSAHPEDATFAILRKRAEASLGPHHDHSKGLALFLTAASEQRFDLPVPLAEHTLAYGRPALAPLLFAMDEYARTLIVVVDQMRARFISGFMGRAQREATHVHDLEAHDFRQKQQMPTGRNQGDRAMGGANRDAFDDTISDHRRRFYREVAAQVRQIAEGQGIRRIILGGPGEAAHALKREMHESVAKQVVAIVPIPQWVEDGAVLRLALPAARAVEHRQEVALVDEVVDLAKAGSRGAPGRVAVEDCLARKQVERLILPWPLVDPGLREQLPLAFVSGVAAERLIAEGGVAARLFYTLRPEFADPARSS